MGAVSKLAVAVSLAGAIAALSGPAVAGCKRMGFLVNDYGKDGPTADAKSLLDKHIASWAAEQGIEKYTVGKKDVSCELFLNLIVVDEHTCTASAMVCWGGEKMPASQVDADGTPAAVKPKTKKAEDTQSKKPTTEKAPAKSADAKSEEAKPVVEKAVDAKPAEAKAADDKPAESTKPAQVEAKAPDAAAHVETGALPLSNKPADAPAMKPVIPSDEASANAAEVAAAAAERAAAAAERAAAAAERAAAALNSRAGATAEAAPAAVAPVRPDDAAKP